MPKNFLPLQSCNALNWQVSVRRLRTCRLVGGAVFGLAALACTARAQDNYTYTGATGTAAAPTTSTTFTGAFTDTTTGTVNTTPGATDGTLTFGGGTTTYAATDDIASLTLGGLAFTNTTGSTVTINAANGATINGTGATLGFAVSTGAVVFNPAINEGTSTLTFSGGGTGAQTTIGGVIGGSGGLTDGMAGTLTLNALNTYTGGTIVNAGTLSLNTSSGTGTVQGVVTVNPGATLNLAVQDALGYNAGAQVTLVNVKGGTVTSVAGRNEGFLTSYNLTGGTVAAGSLFRFSVDAAAPPKIASSPSGTTSVFAAPIDDFGNTGSLGISVATGNTANNIDLTISGAIQGGGGLVKSGFGYLNLTGQNTFNGPVTINGGTVNVGTNGQNNGAGALGTSNAAGKTITVNAGATLSGTINNWFGNGAGTNPAITVNGGTLTTSRYTAIGALALNGATVTNNETQDAGAFQSFQLRGDVTVGGTAPSTITSTSVTATTGGYHLGANTTFTVAATGSTGPDLVVSAPLINQSGDFGNAAGGLTKAGAGTMMLSMANTYTGATTVNAGALFVSSSGSLAAGSAVTVNNPGSVLGGTGLINGTVTIGNGAILSAGNRALATPVTGALVTGPLTLQTGSTFNALLTSGGSFSTLNAAGTTVLSNAAFSISLTPGATFTNGQVLELIISNVNGAFTNSAFTVGGYTFTADYTNAPDPGTFAVDVRAVPEPTYGLLLAGLVGVAVASRRRTIKGWLRAARG